MPARPSPSDRRTARAAALVLLYRRLARPRGRRGADPNDRRVDHALELAARRMDPERLDALLRDGEDG